MARMIDADKLIEKLQRLIEATKYMYRESDNSDLKKGYIGEITGYEIAIDAIKEGGNNE